MQKAILFLGDSFTWGEGLELYCDTPKWITERSKDNGWLELVNKQDDDGIKFREQNRFSTLVANHFNRTPILDSKNGGSLGRNIHIATQNLLDPDLYIDTIILQFSALTREPLHLDYWCRCDVCQKTGYDVLYERLPDAIRKIVLQQKLSENEKYILDYFENKLNCKIDDPNFFSKFTEDKYKWYSNKLEDFYYRYITDWKSNGKRNIYFLDSWEMETSYALHRKFIKKEIDWFIDNKIPLITENNKTYLKWDDWESTFKFRRISDEFRGTCNDHPTLLQQQYLAKSIINFLKERNYE